jgi:hypothetical protein
MGVFDHIGREEFQNFRQDASEHFGMLHECDKKIERKIDELAARLAPVMEEYDRSVASRRGQHEMKMLAIGAALGSLFSAATTALLFVLELG